MQAGLWIENSPVESLGGVNVKLNISPQCVLAAQKDNCVLVLNQKHDQQVEGGDCAALLHSHETLGSVLGSSLGLLKQER